MNNQITIRSDRKDDYKFQYKGEDVTLKAGSIISIADGLAEVVLPTCAMKIVKFAEEEFVDELISEDEIPF